MKNLNELMQEIESWPVEERPVRCNYEDCSNKRDCPHAKPHRKGRKCQEACLIYTHKVDVACEKINTLFTVSDLVHIQ